MTQGGSASGKASGFDLDRFVAAQSPVIDRALAELRGGDKRSHWMWFVFPQIAGLGHSSMARRFALAGLEEARAYLAHPVLGPRLLDATRLVIGHRDRSLKAIFGSPDDLKFISCMTLFMQAAGDAHPEFRQALASFNNGKPDPRTLALIGSQTD